MTLRFLSPQTAAVARDVSLLDLLSEFIDAHADTVCLIRGDRRRVQTRISPFGSHRDVGGVILAVRCPVPPGPRNHRRPET